MTLEEKVDTLCRITALEYREKELNYNLGRAVNVGPRERIPALKAEGEKTFREKATLMQRLAEIDPTP